MCDMTSSLDLAAIDAFDLLLPGSPSSYLDDKEPEVKCKSPELPWAPCSMLT